jgi:hypothetical protein
MIAHILALAAVILLIATIFGLILWAHIADQRSFDHATLAACHKTCRHVDLAEEALRAEQRKNAPELADSLGKFLSALLNSALSRKQAV